MNRKYFGTDGIRGIAGVSPLDPETIVRLGKAIAHLFVSRGGKHKILIGKDTRLSGYMIETALASGITSMGAEAMLVGPLPTPGVAYLTRSMRADAGVMVSASHNPFRDNGIKIFAGDGFKLPDELERQLEELLDGSTLNKTVAAPEKIGKAVRIDDAIGRYNVYLKESFPRDCTLEGMRIGFDGANGAGYLVGPQVLTELGAEVVKIGVSPNGKNINQDFGSLYPDVMAELVEAEKLNIGISLDGDADRVVCIDEKGSILDGDEVLAICALDLKARGMLPNNQIVATVMSNLGLEKLLNENGISVLRAPVGDRYVLEEMIKSGSMLGGEQSGHTIFSHASTTGDGILTALMMLSIMCRSKKPLSALRSGLLKFPQKMVSFAVSRKPPLETMPKVYSAIQKSEAELNGRGRVLVRYSGTENKIRVMVECDDEKLCTQHVDSLVSVIQGELGK
jgi:phosphoglucosamine mutase